MVITIQVSRQLVETLKKRRQYDKESYEEIIWNLVGDILEINEQEQTTKLVIFMHMSRLKKS
jgi:hypothetical protein